MTINYYARCGYRFLLLHRNREDDAPPLSVRTSVHFRSSAFPSRGLLAHDNARMEWLGPWLAQSTTMEMQKNIDER